MMKHYLKISRSMGKIRSIKNKEFTSKTTFISEKGINLYINSRIREYGKRVT